MDLLRFWSSWEPPADSFERKKSRWQTWEQYLGEYAQVREELLARRAQTHPGWPTFAEFVYQAHLTGRDRDAAIDAFDEARDAVTARVPQTDRDGDSAA